MSKQILKKRLFSPQNCNVQEGEAYGLVLTKIKTCFIKLWESSSHQLTWPLFHVGPQPPAGVYGPDFAQQN